MLVNSKVIQGKLRVNLIAQRTIQLLSFAFSNCGLLQLKDSDFTLSLSPNGIQLQH